MHELIAAGPSIALAVHQPSLRYFLLDHGRVQSAGLPPDNLISALVALETSKNPAETAAATDRLIDLLARYDDRALTEAFSAWVDALLLPRTRTETAADPLTRIKEARTMLAERVQEWTREWLEQGRTEGREQGRTEGREQGRTEGREQALAESRQQALAAERTLLRRQATRKFEATTADQLAGAIADLNDPERLAEVGEAIIDCNTASALIERIRVICQQDAAEDEH